MSSEPSRRLSRARSPTRKDGRRVWSRTSLEAALTPGLLAAFDAFTAALPHIPMSADRTRKIPTRNVRKWIADLDLPRYAPVWKPLVAKLRDDDSPYRAWGDLWDRDFCRFVLGKLITADNQSRQAVNNAIKRELDTPVESASSSKSKTFRDLFREKCRAGDVRLPALHLHPPPVRTSSAASTTTTTTNTTTNAPAATAALPAVGLQLPALAPAGDPRETHALYVASPVPPRRLHDVTLFNAKKRRLSDCRSPVTLAAASPVVISLMEAVHRYRDLCGTDEWGRTAWWKIPLHEVNKLPFWLAQQTPQQSALFELKNLLLDFRWIRRTFECAGFASMRHVATAGYDHLLRIAAACPDRLPAVDVEAFRLIRNALMVIIPILANDSVADPKNDTFIAHLATQLVGRLLNLKMRFPIIACLIQSIELHAPRPWLRPLNPCFQEPRTDIKIAVPSNGTFTPHLIVLSQDGALLAASGARKEPSPAAAPTATAAAVGAAAGKYSDGKSWTSTTKGKVKTEGRSKERKVSSIRIWDVETGKRVCHVDQIESLVRCLAIAPDHKCVIGETVDGLFFWKLEKRGEDYHASGPVEAQPRPNPVTSITPTTRTHEVLTTSRSSAEEGAHEGTITLWNTETGTRLRQFDCVRSKATCTDVSLDGNYFASGHDNGFIHLWSLSGSEQEPVLSFKNEGAVAENGQQHVALAKVNRTMYNATLKTISLSFDGKEEERWLAAVSANQIIRVWELPPGSIIRKGKESFVTSIRREVLRCPCVQQVQWSQCRRFFSAGDDGIARMWSQREEGGRWEAQALGREKRERASDVSAVLLSTGKNTKLVATYVTKSPYVTVWDMSGFDGGESSAVARRRRLYRSYMCMVPGSVDARDIAHLTALEKTNSGMGNGCGAGNGSLEGMAGYGFGDNAKSIREELEKRFQKLDIKNATKLVDDMHPRLTMQPEEWEPGLEVCFEQPVIIGVSGTFRTAEHEGRGKIGVDAAAANAAGIPGAQVWARGLEFEQGRRGMAAALQDGAIAMFELEGAPARPPKPEPKVEVKVIGATPKAGNGAVVAEEKVSKAV